MADVTSVHTPIVASRHGTMRSILPWVYYGGLDALLLGIVLGVHKWILPAGAASNLGNNSEAYFFALVLAAWIQYGRARWPAPRAWSVALVLGAAWFLVGLGLGASSLPTRIKTLQEPSLALGLLIPYVTPPRPLPRVIVAGLPIIAIVTIVVGVKVGAPPPGEALGFSNWVISQAETLGFVALVPIALDVVDRGILDRAAVTSTAARRTFYVLLAVVPLGVAALGRAERVGNEFVPLFLNYVARQHETFIAVLIVALYFAVGLGWRGRPVGHVALTGDD